MYAERHVVTLTTDGDGNATGYTPVVSGRVFTVQYVKDGSNAFANGVGLTVTGETSAIPVVAFANMNASTLLAPRMPTHAAQDGSALLHAAGGTSVGDYIVVAAERIKVAIAAGGDTKVGTVTITVG